MVSRFKFENCLLRDFTQCDGLMVWQEWYIFPSLSRPPPSFKEVTPSSRTHMRQLLIREQCLQREQKLEPPPSSFPNNAGETELASQKVISSLTLFFFVKVKWMHHDFLRFSLHILEKVIYKVFLSVSVTRPKYSIPWRYYLVGNKKSIKTSSSLSFLFSLLKLFTAWETQKLQNESSLS